MRENWSIHSLKHDGRQHRTWHENLRVPDELLADAHREECLLVLVNGRTPVTEADGTTWITRTRAVSFFKPGWWYNIVALPMEGRLSYYCNLASPPEVDAAAIRYVDYDLDVLVSPEGLVTIDDEDEYELHSERYGYPETIREAVRTGLEELLARIREGAAPFGDEEAIRRYLALFPDEQAAD
ncbi:hypothetical protein J31TS4_43540 [Paenibacillus sp. J31TS4]|uniref:DUF402 domain-containing protein n=1 Tax=Paenibacillus sp. J31TS4 TaxID=2807195 RepID=UPI001B1CB275|nr:DUF402 domain-containing protein [Paenibacillus sp. J31TS4]GIP41074.1 hypothetical protein J31TS4_43540 [Paenibacillus sp. J31TS4]